MDGVLNIDKPVGMTSFDVVARIRKLTNTKKVGHAGTLDPDASGVLPVCVGRATKIIEFLMDKNKSYRVGLFLGKTTDTQDSSGKTIYEKPVVHENSVIEETIKSFIGRIEQIPPMYSALRVNGQRLYDLARKGIEIERKPRIVTFHSIDIIDIVRHQDKVKVIMDVECSKGTYMRTLCHDIGEKLNCGGHMFSLVRIKSGPFSLDSSFSLDKLEELKNQNELDAAIIGIDKVLPNFPPVNLPEKEALKLRNGLVLSGYELVTGYVRVYCGDIFLAIGKVFEKEGKKFLKTHKWINLNFSERMK
ncbi:MAG: tRNA pseudouridine(55) synthase TruB [Clostridiaceae bacterium]|nr:tRNA pseudouridine(55) synthase TruB [Clostridiaceae bacterium]